MPRNRGSHLTYEERCQIYALLKRGISRRGIAQDLKVSHSTIVRELKRNKGKSGYRFEQAHRLSTSRRHCASTKTSKMTIQNKSLIVDMLESMQASPVQISGRLFKEYGIEISHETIYKWIWADKRKGGTYWKHLRHRAKKYNKRSAKQAGRGLIPRRIDISKRPAIVEDKVRFGDFELDTIVGAHHQGAIVSVVDRVSKVVFLRLLKRGTADAVKHVLVDMLSDFTKDGLVKTLTSDNGKEFSAHEWVSKMTGGDFFFATPYHSWERGLNEHTNGLSRQYFPKGTDFTKLTSQEVAEVERKLNNRPRAILNFETPKECAFRLCPHLSPGAFHY